MVGIEVLDDGCCGLLGKGFEVDGNDFFDFCGGCEVGLGLVEV